MKWHQTEISEILNILQTREEGLTEGEAAGRLQKYGLNQLNEGKKKKVFSMFLEQFRDIMILILLTAAIISGFIGELTDTVVILCIVVINALIGFFQEYRSEKAMLALKQMAVPFTKVLRDGIQLSETATKLVPGDIVLLEAGDAVPADLRILSSTNLKIEEAALTGESVAIEKISAALTGDLALGDQKNMAFRGTFVSYGRGSGVVIATGMSTELGRIAAMLQESAVMTPLQQRMASFGKKLSLLVVLLCILFFISGWLRGEDLFKMTLTSISLAVAAIPEALPAVITIALALAARRMVRQNSLIRKLPAVETLGSITFICTDKTGTITKNKMHVEEILLGTETYTAETFPRLKETGDGQLLLQAFLLNNDAVVEADRQIRGDSTEKALMETALALGIRNTGWPRIAEIPFDSNRKFMTTFHSQENQIISFTKGAPDLLLEHCPGIDKNFYLTRIEEMAARGYRVMGFACRYRDSIPAFPDPAVDENGLRFLGLAGLIDPPREEVATAVARCRTAGIVPVIITGDHPGTARSIAKRVGILSGEADLVISGQELAAMDPAKLLAVLENIKVYARVSPEQKLQIVKLLQQKGHYVAMTGDGVNDAPGLKRANIGIAMGITGTDVAKEAADMILLDDNFSTIVNAIREGRRIYDNILKFIKYLMTTNSGELWTLLLGPFMGLPIALLPIHILWINLLSDGLPAISLSFEKAEKDIMNRPPRPPQESVFADGRGFHMIWVGMLMASIALLSQVYAIRHNLHWQTIVFNVLCLSQMAHVMAIRSSNQSIFKTGLFTNKPLIFSVLLTLALQFVVTFTPLLQPIFKTQTLSLKEFLGVGIASLPLLFAVEIEKAVLRYRQRKKQNGVIRTEPTPLP